jgi:hypothetical protein
LHEIVHIYAPHTNRFLAEGLAVYLHATLAGNAVSATSICLQRPLRSCFR